jgi:hypothetical protein
MVKTKKIALFNSSRKTIVGNIVMDVIINLTTLLQRRDTQSGLLMKIMPPTAVAWIKPVLV